MKLLVKNQKSGELFGKKKSEVSAKNENSANKKNQKFRRKIELSVKNQKPGQNRNFGQK